MNPKIGEVWFAEFGYQEKPRWTLVVAHHRDGRLAVASVVLLTTHYDGTPYEVTLPRVPWLREQSYINAQSVQPVRLTELVRKAPGQFDAHVLKTVQSTLKAWLGL